MNFDQLRTVLWLRWRLTVNQVKRHGHVWLVIVAIIFWLVLITSVCSFFGSISFGFYLARHLGPYEWMFVWDGIVLAFLSLWTAGLLIELQQSELLSLHKLLHLPISLEGTFVCNYLTSLISLTVGLFVPIMFGLSVAMIATNGWAMVVVPFLIISFVLLVSSVTYQFQGWLATMMQNPRRRRTVVATLTMVIILAAQSPNFINIAFQRSMRLNQNKQMSEATFVQELNQRVARGEMKPEEIQSQIESFRQQQTRHRKAARAEFVDRIKTIGATVTAVIPVTWLAYGVKGAAEGNIWPGLLGCIGAVLISVASLRRSYRTALRLYTGVMDSQVRSAAARPAATASDAKKATPANLLERNWLWASEQVAVIAWSNLRSISRSPETRILVVAPILAPVIMVGLLYAHGATIPVIFRPLIGLGAIAIPMLSLAQLLQNQFGVDRSGYRALVLTAATRRDILLGKNISLLPVIMFLSVLIVVFMQFALRVPLSDLVGLLLQTASIYLMYCMTGNMVSIWFPAAVATGSLKPASANSRVIVAHVVFGLLFPIMWLPALAAYGISALVGFFWLSTPYIPLFLLLSTVQLALTAVLYLRVLRWQGSKLQEREQIILQAVADRPE